MMPPITKADGKRDYASYGSSPELVAPGPCFALFAHAAGRSEPSRVAYHGDYVTIGVAQWYRDEINDDESYVAIR
jgi:hypothetical protein